VIERLDGPAVVARSAAWWRRQYVLVEDVRATSHGALVGSTRAVDAYLKARSLHDRVGALPS